MGEDVEFDDEEERIGVLPFVSVFSKARAGLFANGTISNSMEAAEAASLVETSTGSNGCHTSSSLAPRDDDDRKLGADAMTWWSAFEMVALDESSLTKVGTSV